MNCSYEANTDKASERSPLLDRGAASTNPSDSIFSKAVLCILLAQLCEELAFLGLGGNLQLFASDEAQLNCSPQMASTIMYLFQGTEYFLLREWTLLDLRWTLYGCMAPADYVILQKFKRSLRETCTSLKT